MTNDEHLDLYERLPALYRIRDAEQGYPLRAFLTLIGEQADRLKRNIDELWDDFFVETCADWVIPYIGDLVGNNALHEVAQRRRVDVAKTIYYRRRKGTLAMLEELARDVTGWDAHAVACFELLGWIQHLNHLRYRLAPNPGYQPKGLNPSVVDRVGTVNLRNLDALDSLDGPFDIISHTVDVRPIASQEGWHNIHNIGFFLWRLQQDPLHAITPCQAAGPNDHGYHFSPLGSPAALFTRPERETDDAGLAREIHIHGPIRPLALHADLERCRRQICTEPGAEPISQYVGEGLSLQIIKDGDAIPAQALVCQDLAAWARPPALVTYPDPDDPDEEIEIRIEAGIDPALGRLSFAEGAEPRATVQVTFSYGFSADMGGGPYDRRPCLADPALATWQITVAKDGPVSTLQQALNNWNLQGKPDGIIEIADNGVYGGALSIEPADGRWLVIQARDGFRPTVRPVGNLTITGIHPDAALTLNGLLIEGGVSLQGSLGQLDIVHCTLVPGRSLTEEGAPARLNGISLTALASNDSLHVQIDKCIVGALRLPAEMAGLTVRDCVVDAFEGAAISQTGATDRPGAPAILERSTVFGQVLVTELTLASEVIFTQPVTATRRQCGCVRFCYLPDASRSRTPRRFRCQPDLALEGVTDPDQQALIQARLTPSFTSTRYGTPAYAQLSQTCASEIRIGAEDGSEMGAFCHLKQPQREANLHMRLQEYLPFGLEPGLIYVT